MSRRSDPSSRVNVSDLKLFLDGSNVALKDEIRAWLTTEDSVGYKEQIELSKEDLRAVTTRNLSQFVSNKFFFGREMITNPTKYYTICEIIGCWDLNVVVKIAVHYGLWFSSVLKLGTERHLSVFENPSDNLSVRGCFAMTEIGHGSNVRGLETTATYDVMSQTFIINSPSPSATKFWIGNAARDANFTVCFARLITAGKDHGIHLFIVRIRNDDGSLAKGVHIRDCGHKEGLNGVDNGSISFSNVIIPRENLLNKYADVDADGTYRGFPEPKNFGLTLGALSSGRLLLSAVSTTVIKTVASIATRHAFARRQFGPRGSETPIIHYQTHQVRLMPILARAIVQDTFLKWAKDLWAAKSAKTESFNHSVTAGIKASFTWAMLEAIQTCRECLGGQGLRSLNRISEMKKDVDVFVTFEGDNTVLCQSTTKYLLALLKKGLKSGRNWSGTLLAYLNTLPQHSRRVNGRSSLDLTDLSVLRTLLRQREAVLLKSLATALASGSSAWSSNIDLAVTVAKAHMDRLEAESIIEPLLKGSISARSVAVLTDVVVLDTLVRMEKSLLTFVSHSLLSAETIKTIRPLILEISARLVPDAQDIVSSFAIPEKLLPDDACINF